MNSEIDFPIPETKVLAVASHVVYGHVGNTMATLVMQSFGCDVAAINTVQLSNHLGYGQVKGTCTSASEILELWTGLKLSYLDDFHMLLSGYIPDVPSINTVGQIAQELRKKSIENNGIFIWMLDPVMGDNGKLYVSESVIPAYKNLLRHSDLLLPNQFEAETLSGIKIIDTEMLRLAVSTLHSKYCIPHVLITSLYFDSEDKNSLSVAGSTMTTDRNPRIFIIKIPRIDCFFAGTGDLFAALMLVHFREAVCNTPGLVITRNWCSEDDVESTCLPLAKATEKALAAMHEVLSISKVSRDKEMETYYKTIGGIEAAEINEKAHKEHKLAVTKATEVRIVRNIPRLKNPGVKFAAMKL